MKGTQVVEKLLKKDSRMNQSFAGGWTLQHQAAARKSPDALKLLIAAGADIKATNEDGWTPVHIAIMAGRPETVKYLIDAIGTSKEVFGHKFNPLWLAARSGNKQLFTMVSESITTTDYIFEDEQTTVYDAAINKNRLQIARLLVQRGCFGSSKTSDRTSVANSSSDLKEHLDSSLAIFSFSGAFDSIKEALRSDRRTVDRESLTEALRVACSRGHHAIVTFLVQEGGRVSAKDSNGRTGLRHALSHCHFEIAEYLVEKGCSLTSEDDIGFTPIDIAVRKDSAVSTSLKSTWPTSAWASVVGRRCCPLHGMRTDLR
ncbi:ankyrin repeat-containing domain protein [Xylariaceae sp. FL0016]|nr:ankyrin repeat-containing domain protein [Xylariaceae sp. FL0016]